MAGADRENTGGGSQQRGSARRDFDPHADRTVTVIELLDKLLQFLVRQTDCADDMRSLPNDSGKRFST